ncbi:MAG: acyltransferase family protein [Halieaceae bacterium]|uniref:lysophospholipid acyltransferase family protein n=1 Tax=Haliea alexandrii TaxID=2448162 RepID=UPI000F0B80CA|nr:lysophospholipid acyltransferase family protein [Haliea alexandrii]MCR9184976.1 acyltransferase family protein [Halieaceae bacterium]
MTALDKDNQPLAGERLQRHIERALALTEVPQSRDLQIAYQLIKRLFRPVVSGVEHIPDKPCLFVGNHSLFALDGMIVVSMLQQQYGRFLRPLGDKFLFTHPSLENALLARGAAMGHPDVCRALMVHGQDLLVFPGGAHEAVKPNRLRYQLQWKERFGFIRMAAEHGYTIMPFGIVGPDEFYDHLIESEALPDSLPGRFLQRVGLLTDDTRGDALPPIAMGALGSLLPKPQRCYLGFGQPVSLAAYARRKPGKVQQRKIRDQIAGEIEQQLRELLLLREQQRGENSLLRRILTL